MRLRGRRERERAGLTLIDGVRETMRALSGGAQLREAFIVPELLVDPEANALLERLREESVPVVELGREAKKSSRTAIGWTASSPWPRPRCAGWPISSCRQSR